MVSFLKKVGDYFRKQPAPVKTVATEKPVELKVTETGKIVAPAPSKPVVVPATVPAAAKNVGPFEGYTLDQMLDIHDLCYDYLIELKIREDDGKNKSKSGWVQRFQNAVGSPMRQAWCVDVQMFMFKWVNKKEECVKQIADVLLKRGKINLKQYSAFKSFIELCDKNMVDTEGTIYLADITKQKSPFMISAKPVRGCIGIYRHGQKAEGHAVRVRRWLSSGLMTTDEGNTGPASKTIEREGDGFYQKTRYWDRPMGDMHIIAFVVPWAVKPAAKK